MVGAVAVQSGGGNDLPASVEADIVSIHARRFLSPVARRPLAISICVVLPSDAVVRFIANCHDVAGRIDIEALRRDAIKEWRSFLSGPKFLAIRIHLESNDRRVLK